MTSLATFIYQPIVKKNVENQLFDCVRFLKIFLKL